MAAKMPADFRSTERGRRQAWFGYKRYVKRALSTRLLHPLVRAGSHFTPSSMSSGRLPAPAALRESEGVVEGRSFYMLDPSRCVVAKELYWGRGRRPAARDALALDLFCERSKRVDIVVDVGAYTGLFTLAAAVTNPSARMYSYEIIPEVFKALFDNCVRNDILPRVSLRCAGVASAPGIGVFPSNFGGSALPDFLSLETEFGSGVAVPLVSLDDELASVPSNTSMIMKIDVEGTEAEVLAGSLATLSRLRPDILCEVLPGADGGPIERLLAPHGYRFFKIADLLVPAEHIVADDPQCRDWFFSADPGFTVQA
jgi:FkbM family methyltransferase